MRSRSPEHYLHVASACSWYGDYSLGGLFLTSSHRLMRTSMAYLGGVNFDLSYSHRPPFRRWTADAQQTVFEVHITSHRMHLR